MFDYWLNTFFMLNERVPSILEHVTTHHVTSRTVDDIYLTIVDDYLVLGFFSQVPVGFLGFCSIWICEVSMKRDISSQIPSFLVFNGFFGFPRLSHLWKLKCLITDVGGNFFFGPILAKRKIDLQKFAHLNRRIFTSYKIVLPQQ